jgi:phosphatidylglycerophosphate synthase
MTAHATHTRLNESLLAGVEKRTLVWIAHRLPRGVNSDHLSALGLAGMAGAGAAFAAGGSHPWALALVVVGLAVNWFGDSLDGTLARVRNRQRPRYGYYLDHTLDVLGTFFLFGGLALGGLMSPVVAMALLAAYYAVMAEIFLATSVRGVFRMSFFGFGPTELRILLAAGAIALMVRGPLVEVAGLGPALLLDIGGAIGAVALGVTFVISACRNARALYEAEPLQG